MAMRLSPGRLVRPRIFLPQSQRLGRAAELSVAEPPTVDEPPTSIACSVQCFRRLVASPHACTLGQPC